MVVQLVAAATQLPRGQKTNDKQVMGTRGHLEVGGKGGRHPEGAAALRPD